MVFIKYCVFSKILKYIPDSGLSRFPLGVSVCTQWQVKHRRCSRIYTVQKNHNILGKNTIFIEHPVHIYIYTYIHKYIQIDIFLGAKLIYSFWCLNHRFLHWIPVGPILCNCCLLLDCRILSCSYLQTLVLDVEHLLLHSMVHSFLVSFFWIRFQRGNRAPRSGESATTTGDWPRSSFQRIETTIMTLSVTINKYIYI